ncbi:MAG: RecQ family ATP-dependent DNA helicase [Planctomycetota bacterium]|nr:RecQ family ATP-dependent DNA helicase [Planctomycetota bacterium]
MAHKGDEDPTRDGFRMNGRKASNGDMDALSILNTRFGHAAFRGQQKAIIDRTMAGGHSLVIMPTGGGKSLCYQIPAMLHIANDATQPKSGSKPALTVVLSPLIALMKDQVDALEDKGIRAAYINSSLNRQERETRYAQVAKGQFDLLYVTPERFRKPEFVDVLSQRNIQLLAVDEAHCISEWGHDFRPDYTRLKEFRKIVGDPTTIALTATATPEVQQDIVRQLGLESNDVSMFHEGIDRPNLAISVEEVWGNEEKFEHILRIVKQYDQSDGNGIVYFTLIRTLDAFSEMLRKKQVPHFCYHGDLERRERRRVQNDFMRSQNAFVLATNAFGMGIDKEDIRFVIHAEMPGSMESWYQEIGRAGRDGKQSDCVLLYDEHDLTTQMEFIQWSNPTAEYYGRVYDLLQHRAEEVEAFGMEWVRDTLHPKRRHDHRIDTALQMFDRHGVIADARSRRVPTIVGELPAQLMDEARLEEKLRRDQQKLYALVQLIRHEGDRKAFIHEYFGLPYRKHSPKE